MSCNFSFVVFLFLVLMSFIVFSDFDLGGFDTGGCPQDDTFVDDTMNDNCDDIVELDTGDNNTFTLTDDYDNGTCFKITGGSDEFTFDCDGHYISGAGDPRCKILIVMGKTDPDAETHQQQSMILVPFDTPGVELVRNRETLEPADTEAERVIDEMKARGFLLSTDGPLHNVLKIKPPLVLGPEEVDLALEVLDRILAEDFRAIE